MTGIGIGEVGPAFVGHGARNGGIEVWEKKGKVPIESSRRRGV